MSAYLDTGPLQPGDRAPNIVLDAITRDGKIAIDDFRGQRPVLVGLYRGLHCPFCRRHIAALSQLTPALNEKGMKKSKPGYDEYVRRTSGFIPWKPRPPTAER